ncbi:MAG: hypothetical protein K0A95_09640 [Chromatiales bacterium]|nr:hypothetical protein [Chromatiales bacterium]
MKGLIPGGLATTLLAALLVVMPLHAETQDYAALRSIPAQLQVSFESVAIDADEQMGLFGAHYLFQTHPNGYLGVSGYGAVTGQRGGFFTGGFTLAAQWPLAPRWWLDGSMFVGGGGGGSAPQGSGLMLRPQLGVSRELANLRLGVGLSQVRFPDGAIDSRQLNVYLGMPFDWRYAHAADAGRQVSADDLRGLAWGEGEWQATLAEYRPRAGASTTEGTPMQSLRRVGVEYRSYLDSGAYLMIESGGAMSGDADGFAEILAGMGYRRPLTSRLGMSAALSAGGAGGGRVDTDGGLVAKARIGMDYHLGPAAKLGVDLGRMQSAGSFAADFYGINLAYRLGGLRSAVPGQAWSGERLPQLRKWRLVAIEHRQPNAARKNIQAMDLGLYGLKIDKFLDDNMYMTGQAYGAYHGGAGGYAVGLLGAGWEQSLNASGRLRAHVELTAGAAGGGGIDVGGGAILQPMLGLSWRLDHQFGLRLETGRVRAVNGELDSALWGLGLSYEFSRAERAY